MNDQRFFAKQNARLAAELGTSPTGLARFEWGWSEDPKYFHPTLAVDAFGQAIYDSRCQCGLNVPDDSHKPFCSQAVIREQRFQATRLFDFQGYPDENNQPIRSRWLLWRWKAPPSQAIWPAYESAGLHPAHYRRGAYEPCSATTDNGMPFVLCIPHGASHDQIENLTILCIGAYRTRMAQNERNPGQALEERKAIQARHQRQQRENLHGRILDETLVMGHLPGEKDGVSFRQVVPRSTPRPRPQPGERRSPGGIILPN